MHIVFVVGLLQEKGIQYAKYKKIYIANYYGVDGSRLSGYNSASE